MTTTIDINELRRLAQAATPGPWHATKSVETNSWAVWSDTTRLMELRPMKTVDMYRVSNTAAFIAAVNPTAISELLDRLEAAESALSNLGVTPEEAKEALARHKATLARLEAAEKERDTLRTELNEIRYGVAVAHDTIKALRAKIEQMEKQGPVAWMGRGPRDGRIEFSVDKPSPSVMRDFNMTPLYALPGAEGE